MARVRSVGEGGWYWRGPHHRPRVWPRAPDLSSALANAGLEALGDVASPPASDSVMRTTASDRALHPFPGGAYLDSVEEDENEQAADFEHSFRAHSSPPQQSPEHHRHSREYGEGSREANAEVLPVDDLFVLQARLKELQHQLISKESSIAEESASSEREQGEERDRQRARAEVAAAEEISSLREQLEHQRQELADRDQELAQYQRALSAAKEFETAAAANSAARTQLALVENALAQAESKLAVLEPENVQMREEISSLKSARSAVGDAVDQAERKLLQQTEDSARVEAESATLREDCERLRGQLREARTVAESATAEAAESSRLLSQLRSEPERLEAARRQIATLEDRLKDTLLENEALRSRTNAAVDAAAACGEGAGGSALAVLRHEVRVLKAQLVEVKAERDAANEAEVVVRRQAALAEQDVTMLKHRLGLATASASAVLGPEQVAAAEASASSSSAAPFRQRQAPSVSPSLDHDHSSGATGDIRGCSSSRMTSPVRSGATGAGAGGGGATDVHVSWSESSLISEQPRSDHSGSSSGSGGSEQRFAHGGRQSTRPQVEQTAFHTPGPGGAVDNDALRPFMSVAPSVAMTEMWSRDIGSDVEARRLRQELGEANATNHQLRSALAQMNKALHL